MKLEKTLGMELHAVSNLLNRRMNAIISSNGAVGITPMHGKILVAISTHMALDYEVYQKDIEAEFDVARSTVTATLKLMKKRGFAAGGRGARRAPETDSPHRSRTTNACAD